MGRRSNEETVYIWVLRCSGVVIIKWKWLNMEIKLDHRLFYRTQPHNFSLCSSKGLSVQCSCRSWTRRQPGLRIFLENLYVPCIFSKCADKNWWINEKKQILTMNFADIYVYSRLIWTNFCDVKFLQKTVNSYNLWRTQLLWSVQGDSNYIAINVRVYNYVKLQHFPVLFMSSFLFSQNRNFNDFEG